MRIAFISVSGQIGGSEMMLLQLVQQLRVSHADWVLQVVVPTDGPLARRAAALGAAVTIVPMPEALRRLGDSTSGGHRARLVLPLVRAAAALHVYQASVESALAAFAPDVIHSNGLKAHVVAARIRRGRAALVWHIHEYVSTRPITRRLVRRYARRCDAVIANSKSVAADVESVIGDRAGVHMIYNAVDLARFAPGGSSADLDGLASMPRAAERTVRAGLVGTFSRWKGHETFLRALAALPASCAVRGYVVGGAVYDTDGSQHSLPELQAMASRLGVRERIGFTGFVEAPEDALRALDIVVHASTEPEAFGLVIAEAMACGRAVVTSATGGSAELIRDGEDALTHAPLNHRELAARLALLAEDPARRARMGAAARLSAERRFDARRLGGEFAGVYEHVRAARAAR